MRRLIALACLAYLTIGLSVSAQEAANPDRPVWLRYPAVSPDGTRVAFCWGGQIWVSAVTGGEAAPLTSALFYSKAPFWSPDGEYIAFSSDRFGKLDVFIVRATGGEIRRLTYTSVDDSPTGFSADGTLVYFSSRRLGDAVATFHDGESSGFNSMRSRPRGGGNDWSFQRPPWGRARMRRGIGSSTRASRLRNNRGASMPSRMQREIYGYTIRHRDPTGR
jgi:hypothetical protein